MGRNEIAYYELEPHTGAKVDWSPQSKPLQLTQEQEADLDKKRRRNIAAIASHAVPGNWAWNKIEEWQGFSGDEHLDIFPELLQEAA